VSFNDIDGRNLLLIPRKPGGQFFTTIRYSRPSREGCAATQKEGPITFDSDAVEEIASIAFEINAEIENIGARRLQTVMSKLLNEFLFDVPDKIEAQSTIQITKAMVKEKMQGFIKNRDVSEYPSY